MLNVCQRVTSTAVKFFVFVNTWPINLTWILNNPPLTQNRHIHRAKQDLYTFLLLHLK